MSLTRVSNFSLSLDGFATGEGQSQDAPFGHAGVRLHEWMFATRFGSEMLGRPGGTRGIDDAFAQQFLPGIGAEIMGAGKFGPPGWHENPDWKGWWGPNPPFHTPVFVLTRHAREPLVKEGTTFTFVTDGIEAALARAREAAGGRDVAVAGGADVIQQYLGAGLVDELQLHVAPVLLGAGVPLFADDVPEPLRLVRTRVIDSPGAAHLRYRITAG